MIGWILVCVMAPCQGSELLVKVVDEMNRPLACRVLLRTDDGTCHTPGGAVTLDIGRDRWFMCSGRARFQVPAGEALFRIERGLEFVRHRERLDLTDGDVEKQIVLKRWINMKQLGYLCADNHVHLASQLLGPMAIAEGLDFGSSLTWWNGPDQRRPVPQGNRKQCQLHFGGHDIRASVFDAELEHGWGAAYVQNLPHPFPMPSDPNRPNLDYLRYAVDHGAIVHYQGGWSREVGLDALLGRVHTVNVCNNLFHLHRFLPRRRYSNLLNVEGFPDYPNTERGMLQMNTDTYYRLLNWGLKLAAGAGSACGVKQVPVGYNRSYVQVEEDATLDRFYQVWKAGSNFVTNGPMIFLKTKHGHGPGDEIHLKHAGGKLDFQVRVLSGQPLQQVEIIRNGRVIDQVQARGQRKIEHACTLPVQRSCWMAVRCTARDDHLPDEELKAYGTGPALRFSRLRFAHTSPVYVTVANRPAVVAESVEEGLKMLDQLEAYARTNAAPEFLGSFLEATGQAREILRDRIQQ
jgi:hypothetical protein